MYDPTWKNNDIRTIKGSEAFDDERTREMAANPQAKEWEESRKRSIQKQKRAFHIKEEVADKEEEGGSFDRDFEPAKGFVLIKPDFHKKETDTGLTLPDSINPDPNTGIVVTGGRPILLQGDSVLYKKGAGLDLVIKEQELKLMRCVEDVTITDILGVFR